MKTHKTLLTLVCLLGLSASVLAQTGTATWSGSVDNDWNNAGNWDTLDVPGVGTNVVINAGSTPNYSAAMGVANFAGVNNSGTLTVSAPGFNIDALGTLAAYTGNAGSLLQVNSGGVVVATNSIGIALPTGSTNVVQGGVLVITNSTGNISFGVNGNNAGATFTNNGGVVVFSQPFQSRGRYSRFEMHGGSLDLLGGGGIFESSNDQERQFLIDGGTANLGNFTIGRTLNTVGTAGLVISNNATVNVTSLQVGTGIAASGATVYGGVLTNTGTFTISDRTNAATSGTRRAIFYVRGGTVVSTAASGIVVANQPNNSNTGGASVWGGVLDINAGTIVAEKLTLVGPNALTNAYATLTLGGSGAIYLGSGGLVGNVGWSNTSYTMTLSGGTLGAKAEYSIVGNGTLSGTFTVKAADLANTPYNITNTGVWSGSGGSLVKTGGGVLSLTRNNTYGGPTTVSEGTLALAATGSISNSPQISVAAGATFDVSARTGFSLSTSSSPLQTLGGNGTVVGAVSVPSGCAIAPGASVGRLTFSGDLTETGGAINNFELSAATNDTINVVGALNLSGTNSISVVAVGGSLPAGVYKLFGYGTFNGGLTNFSITGAPGFLTNDVLGKTISLNTSGVRGPTNIVWIGGPGNNWDILTSINWQKQSDSSATVFVQGDKVLFDAAGAANPNVTVAATVLPGSVTVGTSADYSFTGAGSIGGTGGLTKTNSGLLTILTTNSYTGVTTIGGGTLAVSLLANGGSSSGIGAAGVDSTNLVMDGGTLSYLGATASTSRGATLNAGGAVLDVTNNGTTLTVSGTLTGAGALAKAGPGALVLSAANTYTNGTRISTGVLQLNNASGAGSGPITNNGATLGVNGAIVVDNAVEFDGPCNLQLSGVSSGNVALRGAWTGSGTVLANFLTQNTNQTLSIGGEGSGGGTMWDFSGTLDFGTNRGFCRLNNNSSYNFGSSNATFNLGAGDMLFSQRNGGTTTYLGALLGGPNTRLSGSRSDVSGNTTYVIGGKNLDTVFEGMITNGQTSSSSIRPAVIVKVGTGKLTLTGSSPYTGATTVEAGTLQVDGSITASAITVTGGTLSGSGTLGGYVDIQYGATLSPGASIGQLTINNGLNLASGSTNIMEISKAAGTNDSVVGLASVSYSGTLVVRNLAGTLSGGDTFKLFDAAPGNYSGAFEYYDLPALPPGLSWDTSGLLVDGTIRVAAPPILEFTVIGSDLVVSGTNGVPNSYYNVLTSTNVAAALSQWTTNATYQFDASGGFSFTNAIDPGTPQRYFILQIP